MPEKSLTSGLEQPTILATYIKTQAELFLQNPQAFQEPKRKIRQINLDPQSLGKFNDLPINLAQMTDVQLLVVVSIAESTQLTMVRNGEEIDRFKHTDPQTTFFYLNFKDRQRPETTFIFALKIADSQPSGAYITQINPNVNDQDARKPSYRKNVASDFTAVRDLLRELNKKDPQTPS